MAGDVFGDVVEDDYGCKEDETDECHLVDALFDLRVQVSTDQALNEQEDNHAAVQDGDGEQVEDAQVEANEGHGADDRYPASHLEGLVNLDADADGARKRFDGDLPGEEAVEDVKDEAGVLEVEGVGLSCSTGEGLTFYIDRGQDALEAETISFTFGGIHQLRSDGDLEGLRVAIDGEDGGLAGLILQVGEHRFYRVWVEAVYGEDLVMRLEAGAGGRHVFFTGE